MLYHACERLDISMMRVLLTITEGLSVIVTSQYNTSTLIISPIVSLPIVTIYL